MTIMKKKYKLQDLDCANCAAKMEEGIRKIPGVEEVSISFTAQHRGGAGYRGRKP
ncbi:MAG: heavy-metal-associated domain-containing protein [Alistipes sp.]|nr:heavy-metal-associated domain-containing protein [Alistipes sp.]